MYMETKPDKTKPHDTRICTIIKHHVTAQLTEARLTCLIRPPGKSNQLASVASLASFVGSVEVTITKCNSVDCARKGVV